MRHATVNAVEHIRAPDLQDRWANAAGVAACNWESISLRTLAHFHAGSAEDLVFGLRVELPTCPACAALVDLALELRGS